MRLLGLYWWIDRWRKSTAFMDMSLAEQGAYRNLLDEAHLRGGVLPLTDRTLAKACGDAMAWPDVRAAVLAHFTRKADGYHNSTLQAVLNQSLRRAEKQAAWRERSGNPVAKTEEEARRRNAARVAAQRAIASGKLVKQPCEVCGAVKVHAHHDDYHRPLTVRWLCHTHHAELHNVIRAGNAGVSVRVTESDCAGNKPGSPDPDPDLVLARSVQLARSPQRASTKKKKHLATSTAAPLKQAITNFQKTHPRRPHARPGYRVR